MAILVTDTETREIVRRMKELSFAFGDPSPHHSLCGQVMDCLQPLLLSEAKRKSYKGRAPQPQRSMRLTLVLFIMKIAEGERLSSATLFSAVYLFDRLFDVHSIATKQLHLVALSCLIIAGKLEEKDTRTPKMKRLQSYIPQESDFSYKLFTMIERFVLGFFDFRVLVPTEVNFLELFMLFGMDGSHISQNNNNKDNNDNDNNNNCSVLQGGLTTVPLSSNSVHILKSIHTPANMSKFDKTTLDKIHNSAMHVLQTLLKYEPTMDYPASLITSAVLLYARREVGLNFWTERLEAVTTYSLRQVLICLRYHVEPTMYSAANPHHQLPDPTYLSSQHTFTFM